MKKKKKNNFKMKKIFFISVSNTSLVMNKQNSSDFLQSVQYETICNTVVGKNLLKKNNHKSGLCPLMIQM